jgi:hypothetical protein
MRRTLSLAGLFLAASVAAASDTRGFSMTLVVDGAPAVEYASRGRFYVEALKGREFSVRLHNPGPGRVAVALSVDGRNVLDAKRTSARDASKWVLAPGQTLDVPGWQISGQTSRRFFFTETERSYAKWLGDTSNVGTIEAVFFREKRVPVAERRAADKDQSGWVSEDEARKIRQTQEALDIAEGGVEGGVPGGMEGGVEGDAPSVQAEVRIAPSSPSASQPRRDAEAKTRKESDRFAATGIGERTGFSVEWIALDLEDRPSATLALRYEFREQLVRLGVLPREREDLAARERARGFAPEYAPDPDGRR